MSNVAVVLAGVPRHIGFIMDGNRRWARKRLLPAGAGHVAGVKVVKRVVEACVQRGIRYVTLFAFSTENWQRPAEEVSWLLRLFDRYLRSEAPALNRSGVRLRILGDRSAFPSRLQDLIGEVEALTAKNCTLDLMVAANYGGRWDIVQAVRAWQRAHTHRSVEELTEQELQRYLATGDAPPVDLIIRTGGEFRTSNFLLWQAAYAELYFTDKLWPDFGPTDLDSALCWFACRERRFGGNGSVGDGNVSSAG